MLGLNKLLLVIITICSTDSDNVQYTNKNNIEQKRGRQNKVGISIILALIRYGFLISTIGLLVCYLNSGSREPLVNKHDEVSIMVGKGRIKYLNKENGIFGWLFDVKEIGEFVFKFIDAINSQQEDAFISAEALFKKEKGLPDIEIFDGNYKDTPFIIGETNGGAYAFKITEKSLTSIEEFLMAEKVFFNSLRSVNALDGFILYPKDNNTVYYCAIIDADKQPLVEAAFSDDDEELYLKTLVKTYLTYCYMLLQTDSPLKLLMDWNETILLHYYPETWFFSSGLFVNSTQEQVKYINQNQKSIIIQNILRIAYNYRMLGEKQVSANSLFIEVTEDSFPTIRDEFTPGLCEFIEYIMKTENISLNEISESEYLRVGDILPLPTNYDDLHHYNFTDDEM